MRTILAVLLWFGVVLSLPGQTLLDSSAISPKTNAIVKKIEAVNTLMGSAVSYSGERPEQYDNFQELKENASIAELEKLTLHPNGVVRCYAFWALTYHYTVELLPIVLAHIDDSETVETLFGCIGGEQSVGDIFIEIATQEYDTEQYSLTSAELATLDSILIYRFSDAGLYAFHRAMERIQPTEQHYARIHELAEQGQPSAIVALAKYRKESDITFFLSKAESPDVVRVMNRVVLHFPHPRFFSFLKGRLAACLEQNCQEYELQQIYPAIACYRNDDARKLLENGLAKVHAVNNQDDHINAVFSAVCRYREPVYSALLWRLWVEENKITPDVFQYLFRENRDKAIAQAAISLQDANKLYNDNVHLSFMEPEDFNNTYDITALMIDTLFEYERAACLALIRDNIRTGNVFVVPVFAEKAGELREPSLVEPLLKRLETEKNPHVFLPVAEALLAYGNDEVNGRVLGCTYANTSLTTGWGGDEFSVLLEQYNLK